MSLLRKITAGLGDLVTDAWGTQKVSLPFSLFHGTFTFDIPPSWFIYENGTQVYTSTEILSVNGEARVATSATNTTTILESRECPRYQPNRGHLFSTALRCPAKTTDGIREWGLATTENGVFFRLKADGLLYAVLKSGGVETHEELIDTSVLGSFDVEKANTYDIQFQWRGAGDYFFYIGNPAKGTTKLVHTFNFLGTLDCVSIENPALPARFTSKRTTADVELFLGCIDITSEAGGQVADVYRSVLADAVSVSATEGPVLVVKLPLQIAGDTNTRTGLVTRLSVTADKKGVFKLWTTRDPTNITGATYKPISSTSFVESDSPDMDATAVRATAVTLANLDFIAAIPVEANKREVIESPIAQEIQVRAVRGDYLIVTNKSSGAGTAQAVMEGGDEI